MKMIELMKNDTTHESDENENEKMKQMVKHDETEEDNDNDEKQHDEMTKMMKSKMHI